ncbi:hypothetical protein [Lysinibacillus telephonicus]|uniref:Uncharacterized protein n=1 Tax=Lysinibacillus telephonicus TaxID=1714840 RepID=A0A3S0HJ19_9BACI|nr:hypothetical protein [Lysinibacillus telephonicus]RTQ93121.1 hypothetical protein EKG35_09900 [Lysinibacillus telephonicus]
MTEYNREELFLIIQMLAGITFTAGCAFSIETFYGTVPAFALIGSAVGLSIIIGCWLGAEHVAFMFTIIVTAVVFSIYFNFGTLFG